MTRVRLKEGVRLGNLQPHAVLALLVLAGVWDEFHVPDMVVTSVFDGTHSRGSLHYKGFAVDLRTRNIGTAFLDSLVDACRTALGAEFDVVLESDHLHVEWDPDD